MALNRLGVECFDGTRPPAPVTLPALELDNIDIEAVERAATAAKFLEARTIRTGVECWQAIGRAESFDAWKRIGAALAIGKTHALKVSGASQAWGRNYSREFSDWIKQHGFERMPAATRSVAVELHEHAEAITSWRNTLPERQRKRLVHPLSVTRRWRASTAHGNGRCAQDLKRDAKAAWARFCACVTALPADEAQPLWRLIAAEATVHIS